MKSILEERGLGPAAPAGPGQSPGLPYARDAVLEGAFFGERHPAAIEGLAEFIARPSLESWFGTRPADLRAAIDRDISAIDVLITEQLDAILHHPRLRRLEGTWRGVAWLVDGLDPSARVKVRLLNAAWAEIVRDLERAAEFDQSHLFRRVYEDEFGTPGGEPYGLLIVDHEIRHRPGPGTPTDDVGALKLLAGVAAAAFSPMILAASPALLEVDGFADLAGVADPGSPFRNAEFARWRGLFGMEDVRFLGVVLPRVLARTPRGDDPARAEPFRYREHAPGAEDRVWMSAAYGFAHTVTRAFSQYAWPADVRGVETDQRAGGLVDDLPTEQVSTDPPLVWPRSPLEVVLTDRQERSLLEAGLMPLSALPYGTDAVFGAVRSLQTPKSYMGANAAAAGANARLSTQINTMLCVSRFAHYIKVMGRDMVGALLTADTVERRLQSWLTTYVNSNTGGGPEMRSRYPLVAGEVTVRERPGKPGVYSCVAHLQPQFQLDDVSATFRLATDIAAPGSR